MKDSSALKCEQTRLTNCFGSVSRVQAVSNWTDGDALQIKVTVTMLGDVMIDTPHVWLFSVSCLAGKTNLNTVDHDNTVLQAVSKLHE